MSDAPSPHDTYTSPLAARNASPAMCRIWSPRHKFQTWRRIWLAVAEAQYEVTKDWAINSEKTKRAPRIGEGSTGKGGPHAHAKGSSRGPLVTKDQIEELRANLEVTDEDLALASRYEAELRHDVMAHVHAWGDKCPKARPIIHLGMTSQDVVCNADLMAQFEAIGLIERKIAAVVIAFGDLADRYKAAATLGFTHYQPAQPTTIGRRAAGWANALDQTTPSKRDTGLGAGFRLRGFKGATGTQASFLALFDKKPEAVDRFERHAAQALVSSVGLASVRFFELTGQTYPRSHDGAVLASLANVAAVLHKIATDIRLLSNRKELDEPFGKNQIGSSAMPYKRNPMKCERICGLSRFVLNLVGNAYDTAATQWLERTLDDSSNRRLSLPESFLALDGALDLMHTVASGLVVNEAMVRKNLMAELPFMATENILMEAVKLGGDRQDLHERIRIHAQAAGMRVKQEGLDNDLIERLKSDPSFAPVHHLLTEGDLLDPVNYIGRSVEQTERFLNELVEPLRARYGEELESLGSTDRGV